MVDVKYKPVSHDHEAFLKKASKRKEFRKAYEDLEEEYRLTREMLQGTPLIRYFSTGVFIPGTAGPTTTTVSESGRRYLRAAAFT